jgi:signal transduction histidine kinase
MTFSGKLLLAFLVMLIPLAIIGAQAWRNLQEETRALETLEESLSRARIFADAESTVYRKLRRVRDHLAGGDTEAKADFERLDVLVHRRLEDWKRATLDPEDHRLADQLGGLDREVTGLARRAFALAEDGQRDLAMALIRTELNGRLLPAIDATIRNIYTSSRTHNIQRALKNLQATERSTSMVLAGIIIGSVLFGVVFSLLVSRSLARPVSQLSQMIDLAARGEFDQARAIEVRSRDELGQLARAFVAMAERLQRAQQDIVQAEKLASIGQMSAAVAHGLRNPLASIRAATQLARHQLPPQNPQREHLSAVIEEVDRLEKRISHLLDFTKPMPFAPGTEAASDLVERTLAVFQDRLAGQGIELQRDLDPALPPLWVDGEQLEQALLEVISNAAEAMPKGGRLAIRGACERGDRVTLTVSDTGEGIAPAALAHVTEPFFTTKADGTGLGLAIAKRFVEQNRGSLAISSRENAGTSVTISLPAGPDAAGPPPPGHAGIPERA